MWNKDELSTFPGFPQIVIGWTDDENDITHDRYLQDMEATLEGCVWDTAEGADVEPPTLPNFAAWKDSERERVEPGVGFSHTQCDLCGTHLGGERWKATALPENPAENKDYISLEICADCMIWIANGDEPEN